MGNRATPPRSFNTVKHSNRKERQQRRERGRMTLLSICVVFLAILLTTAVFIFCSLADELNGRKDKDESGKETETTDQNTPAADITYAQITQANSKIHEGELIVVSQKLNAIYTYPNITLKSFTDPDIHIKQNGANPYQITVLKRNEQMETTAAYAVDKMLTDYYQKSGDSSLIFIDAYRTKEEQSPKSTPVGYSEHETGLVFTLQTYDSANNRTNLAANAEAADWIYKSCAKYGLIQRYQNSKSDLTGISGYEHCFRYVGVPHATYISEKNICLEEYVDLLKTDYSQGEHLKITGADGNSYEVYYVAAGSGDLTTLSVPSNYNYSISGDNIGGFIVTVNLSAPKA